MGPVAGFGIADATLEIVGEFNGVTLAARGSPMVLAGEQSNLFLNFVKEATESIVLEVSAKYLYAGTMEFALKAGTKPIKFSKTVKMADARDTIGPYAFMRYKMSHMVGGGAPTSVTDVGLNLPLLFV